jgi:formylglycine-generating enzyme required for sulfatase activity
MRAGATTRFCFGEWEELLGEYAWYIKNAYEAPRPTGVLKPNDFGLFDAHGNVRELGQEWISHAGGDSNVKTGQRKHKLDIEDMTPIVNVGHYRIARSGSFRDYVFNIRCSRRDKMPILSASVDMGIRLARTLVHHPIESAK